MRKLSQNLKHLPNNFYNIKADLSTLPPPPLNPLTKEPLNPEDLSIIFPKSFIQQEISLERYIKIPDKVLEIYSLFRPTPLIYASKLKEYLNTPANIFYKYEGVSPTGSHKTNTAIMQAYLAKNDGINALTTETGAGQWGSALSYACSIFGLKVKIFMVRTSFRNKPGRKTIIELLGGDVVESPSTLTDAGKKFYKENPDHPGSLGIAISEAVEIALKNQDIKYSLGSVLDSVLLHQTIIGLEAESQLNEAGISPDIIIGCVGGGSNFAGLSFPFISNILSNKNTKKDKIRFIAVEPESCASLTKGKLMYDHGDTAGLTPLLFMHSLGKDFVPPPIHAGGLRYHGMAPLVSHLVKEKVVEPKSYSQEKIFEAAKLFLKTEGILPAPESSHAIAAVIDEAIKTRETGKNLNILFNLSGHGFLDISAYS